RGLSDKQKIIRMISNCRALIKKKDLKQAGAQMKGIRKKIRVSKINEIDKNIFRKELVILHDDIKLKSLDQK
ncbi:hypothetical protein KY328_04125, partial [Candidatus Woesearchaeota archaeon]|nr:hypothetical protein [Candidatus Woesearchaeota archaeon]